MDQRQAKLLGSLGCYTRVTAPARRQLREAKKLVIRWCDGCDKSIVAHRYPNRAIVRARKKTFTAVQDCSLPHQILGGSTPANSIGLSQQPETLRQESCFLLKLLHSDRSCVGEMSPSFTGSRSKRGCSKTASIFRTRLSAGQSFRALLSCVILLLYGSL